jgi:hypothetical protein
MTKQAIFTAAHATAKTTRGNFETYKAAFSAALKLVYSQSKNNITMTVSEFFGEVRNFNGKIYQDKFIYVDNQKVEATASELAFAASKLGLINGFTMTEKIVNFIQENFICFFENAKYTFVAYVYGTRFQTIAKSKESGILFKREFFTKEQLDTAIELLKSQA